MRVSHHETVGRALCGFSHDHAGARASVERLAALDVQAIALSHYPAWRDDCNASLDRLATLAVG